MDGWTQIKETESDKIKVSRKDGELIVTLTFIDGAKKTEIELTQADMAEIQLRTLKFLFGEKVQTFDLITDPIEFATKNEQPHTHTHGVCGMKEVDATIQIVRSGETIFADIIMNNGIHIQISESELEDTLQQVNEFKLGKFDWITDPVATAIANSQKMYPNSDCNG